MHEFLHDPRFTRTDCPSDIRAAIRGGLLIECETALASYTTVLIYWKDGKVINTLTLINRSPDDLSQLVTRLAQRYHDDAPFLFAIHQAGSGAAVLDRLRARGIPAIGIDRRTARSADEYWQHLRARLADVVRHGTPVPMIEKTAPAPAPRREVNPTSIVVEAGGGLHLNGMDYPAGTYRVGTDGAVTPMAATGKPALTPIDHAGRFAIGALLGALAMTIYYFAHH